VLNYSFSFKIAMCWPAGAFPVLCAVFKHEETFLLPMLGENVDSYDTGWVVVTISHAPPSSLPFSLTLPSSK
jgi:hypothetical protein